MDDEGGISVLPDSESLESNEQSQNKEARIMRAESHFIGPIPPPDVLGKYEQLIPGSADRIIRMAEKQNNHRLGLEKMMIQGNISRSDYGLKWGYSIAVVFAIGGFYLVIIGKEISGWVALAGAVLPSVIARFGAKKQQTKELDKHIGE